MTKDTFRLREVGETEWEDVPAWNDYDAVRQFAKQRELGYHDCLDMVVEIMKVGVGTVRKVRVVTEWDPNYVVEEMKDAG